MTAAVALITIAEWLASPTEVMVGPVRMLLPAGRPCLTDKQLRLMERAWIAASEGRVGAIEVNVEKIERDIWPTGFDPHRQWPLERSITIPTTEAKEKAQMARVAGLAPVDDGLSRLTLNDQAAADAAIKRLANAKTADNRQKAAKDLAGVIRRPKQRVDQEWRKDSTAETVALATARGEEGEFDPKRGTATIISRDGLKHLAQLNKISQAQFLIGCVYTDGYETRAQDMGAMNVGDAGHTAHDNEGFIAKRFERALALAFVARTDRVVALAVGVKHPSALQMLRWVAGQRNSINVWGEGRAHARNVAALCAALDAAAVVAKVMREERRRKAEQGAKV